MDSSTMTVSVRTAPSFWTRTAFGVRILTHVIGVKKASSQLRKLVILVRTGLVRTASSARRAAVSYAKMTFSLALGSALIADLSKGAGLANALRLAALSARTAIT